MRIKAILLVALSVAIMGFNSDEKTKILFFGDSITAMGTSWAGAYINKLGSIAEQEGYSDLELINAGISGNKVTDLYLRLEKDVLDADPDVVVIYIGVNDVWHKYTSGTGTDFNKFGGFYDAIINKLLQNDIKVVLVTPAVIGEKTDNTNECDGDMNRFSNLIRNYAAEKSLPLVDLRKIFMEYNMVHNSENEYKGILTSDGVHLSPEGNELVATEIWKAVKGLLK